MKEEIDTLIEMDSMKKELKYMINRNLQLTQDREILQNNIIFLEEELAKTIETYSKLLKEIPSGNNENSMTLIREINNSIILPNNTQLKDELTTLKNQIKTLYEEKKQLQ